MDIDAALQQVDTGGYETVGVQGPAGLKQEMMDIADRLRERGVEPVLVAEATFGGCDLADHKVEELGGEALIHLGHSPFYLGEHEVDGENIEVLHVPYRLDRDFIPILEDHADIIEEDRIGVVTTAQHMEQVDDVITWLEEHGFDPVKGETGSRVKNQGQVLGCDAGAALSIRDEVDAFLYVGSGRFHPEQIAKHGTTYVLDPVQTAIYELEDALTQEEYLQQQYARVLNHRDAEKWGVIATIKEQNPEPVVEHVKNTLEEHGKDVYVFVGDRIAEGDFNGFGIDIFVNTACPRMVDDFEDFTLVNPEALNALDRIED
ncbi:MAG: diphthamide biosynthesis enzyme Dph2 [Candidatus Nanohaloarchaea archaeon]|nr:diphthamide biosynthesis enzyme Dph2 [Candidatus Nanohaloarchaea archaeon]